MAPTNILGLTTLGTFHTVIALIALGAGIVALLRYKEISPRTRAGRIYVLTTVITCVTGFGIFQHGGFGNPHILGIVTLAVLAVAGIAGYTRLFGRLSPYVETVSYSATFFFHMIPTITEGSNRLPPDAPLLTSHEAPELQTATAILFVVFLVGATAQVIRMRGARRRGSGPELQTMPL
jgi:uncharacterized membrane protein